MRPSWGAVRTYMFPWLMRERKPPPAVMRTVCTPGTEATSVPMARTASSIAGIEMPSGPLMVASNSLSSTSVGVYSCFTQP